MSGRNLFSSFSPMRIFMLVAAIILLFLLGLKKDNLFARLSQEHIALSHANLSPQHPSFPKTLSCPICQKKWFFTLVFPIDYTLLSAFIVWLLFNQKKFILLTLAAYSILFFVCFLLISYGIITDNFPDGYRFANRVMGLAESPLVIMILIPAFKLLPQAQK